MGDQPFKLGIDFDVGRPPGTSRGQSFSMPVAIPVMPLPWRAGRRYVVRVKLDDQEVDRVMFSVRPIPPGQTPKT